uniref:AIG1-type G domain-containing protein n=2 Tax=Myripristis murdjan TaxID=586833 RepID=A0A667XM09_9TELE
MTLDEFIFKVEGALPDVITRSFAGRYHVFNNEAGGLEQVRELLVKSGHLTTNIPTDSVRPEDRRIVLIGRPGVGKSSSGNTILGSDVFKANCDFGAVTTKSKAKAVMVDGRQVTVMDTPGFSDKVLSSERLFEQIMKMLIECRPGPHAFIFVVEIGRISEHDAKLFSLLPILFNSDALKYSMVLFTHGDKLGNQSFEEKIQGSRCLSELVKKCGGRYCVFDNSRKGNRLQVRELLGKIDNMVTANGGECYSSDLFKTAYTFWREAQNRASFEKARDSLGEADNPNSNLPVPYRGQAQCPLPNPNPNPAKPSVWERLIRFLARKWEEIKAFFKSLLLESLVVFAMYLQ